MTISRYLEEDHKRIEHILQQATGSRYGIEAKVYEEFRGALLRHIGMEEKILFPAIRKATGGRSLPRIEQLHLDHGALAALVVPTPTAAIVNALQTILRRHNVIEEGPDGIYRQFEELPGIDTDSVLKRLQAAPAVAMTVNVSSIFDLPNIWHGWRSSHDAIGVPSKKLWFEESEHEPFVDEPAKFNAAMVGVARTAAVPQ